MKKRSLILTSTLALAATSSYGATVFTDPSFENSDPLVDDGNGVGKWNSFAGGGGTPSSLISSANPRTGTDNLELTLAGGGAFAGVFQDIMVNPGDNIAIDLWHLASNNTPGSAIEIRIEWQGGGGEVARTANSTPTPGTTYENFSITHTAPAGADTARVVYAIQSFGGNEDAVINVDDFTATGSTAVPEPSGTLLLSLGALGMLTFRKRR